jgi:hypothetical protein
MARWAATAKRQRIPGSRDANANPTSCWGRARLPEASTARSKAKLGDNLGRDDSAGKIWVVAGGLSGHRAV